MNKMSEKEQKEQYIQSQIGFVDKYCFQECVKKSENKFTYQQEKCLQSCPVKLINSFDFMYELNSKGGVGRVKK